jgi:hypothetical protein
LISVLAQLTMLARMATVDLRIDWQPMDPDLNLHRDLPIRGATSPVAPPSLISHPTAKSLFDS